MQINAGQTLDFWYSANETVTLPTCRQLYLLASSGLIQQLEYHWANTKISTFEAFDEIHKVVIDGISENTASLVQSSMYGAINIDDTTTNGLYVIQFLSEAYTLQNNATIDGQVISSG